MKPKEHLPHCPGCHAHLAAIDGQTFKPYVGTCEACWKVFNDVTAVQYDNEDLSGLHRLAVDAYMAQHPGAEERQSIQSVAVHLMGLCATIEKKMESDDVIKLMQKALEPKGKFTWLAPPDFGLTMKVTEVAEAETPEKHKELIETWAREVWQAWAGHHETIRSWLVAI